MKTNSHRLLAAAVLAVGLNALGFTSAHAAAKPSLDFSKFKGHYSGTWSLSVSGLTVPASVTVRVSVPKNGKVMTVFISGSGSIFGSTVPISTTLKFQARTRKLVSDAYLMGYFGPIATSTAHFSGKGPFRATLSAAPGANLFGTSISGSIPYTIAFSKNKMSILGTGSVTSSGATQQVTIAVSAHK